MVPVPTLSTLPLRESSCHNSTLQLESDSHPSRKWGQAQPSLPHPHPAPSAQEPRPGRDGGPAACPPASCQPPPGVRPEPASGGCRPTLLSDTEVTVSPPAPGGGRRSDPGWTPGRSPRFLPSRWPSDGPAWRGLKGWGPHFLRRGKRRQEGQRGGGLGPGNSPGTTSGRPGAPPRSRTPAPRPRGSAGRARSGWPAGS